jgi:hypothetical protein
MHRDRIFHYPEAPPMSRTLAVAFLAPLLAAAGCRPSNKTPAPDPAGKPAPAVADDKPKADFDGQDALRGMRPPPPRPTISVADPQRAATTHLLPDRR